MALHGGLLSDLALLKERGVVNGSGRIVEIGAQQLSNDFLRSSDHLSRLFGLFDRTAPDFGAPSWAGTVDGLERLPGGIPACILSNQWQPGLAPSSSCTGRI